jgi:hypothetical protein
VFNDCIMEWVNIPSNGLLGVGYQTQSPGQMGARSKDSFSFSFSEYVVHLNRTISGYQKGLAGFEINRKIFHT